MASPEPSRRAAIWGASGHALVVADILRLSGYEVLGYLDNLAPERRGEPFGGATVLGGSEQLAALRGAGVHLMAMGVGHNAARLALARQVREAGLTLLTAVHPRAILASDAGLGEGTVVAAGAVINPACRIGACVIINTAASVDHECRIGDGAHIAPGAHLAGLVEVGDGAFVGIGAAVKDRVRIGANALIGAGAVVLRDVPEGAVAYGNPARTVRPSPTAAVS
jgi:sugar O-acyltransferase (sialic acid O-acetyltransferase NeuD family)